MFLAERKKIDLHLLRMLTNGGHLLLKKVQILLHPRLDSFICFIGSWRSHVYRHTDKSLENSKIISVLTDIPSWAIRYSLRNHILSCLKNILYTRRMLIFNQKISLSFEFFSPSTIFSRLRMEIGKFLKNLHSKDMYISYYCS